MKECVRLIRSFFVDMPRIKVVSKQIRSVLNKDYGCMFANFIIKSMLLLQLFANDNIKSIRGASRINFIFFHIFKIVFKVISNY